MKVDFSSQPDNAKVWVYQASRELTAAELEQVFEIGNFFLDQWESHNLPVKGSLEVKNNRFLIISAFSDEDAMCGRAQDSQMRLVKELEEVVGCKLTDRMLVCYEENDAIDSFHFSDLTKLLAENKITTDTTIFNTQVTTKEAFVNEWKGALKDTWLARFM